MSTTKIEWCDRRFNPVTGCLNKCPYCYARAFAKRFNKGNFEPTFHEDRLYEPAKVKKPSTYFVCTTADLFGYWVEPSWISLVLNVCAGCSWHRFLLLTKNPGRYKEYSYPKNVFCGFSASNQKMFDEGMCAYSMTDFVSLEPLQAPINIMKSNLKWVIIGADTSRRKDKIIPQIEWVANIIEQCRAKGIPVFVKNNVGLPEKIQERMK